MLLPSRRPQYRASEGEDGRAAYTRHRVALAAHDTRAGCRHLCPLSLYRAGQGERASLSTSASCRCKEHFLTDRVCSAGAQQRDAARGTDGVNAVWFLIIFIHTFSLTVGIECPDGIMC